jgi:chromosome partitioning protein
LELLWEGDGGSVFSGVEPILRGLGDIDVPEPSEAAEDLWLLPGDLALSRFEDRLSESWTRGYDGDEAAIRVTTAFHRMSRLAATSVRADVVFVDIGPNLGAINRAALLASDWVVIPLAADLFSLQGLRNLGPTLRGWSRSWSDNTYPKVPDGIDAPRGTMRPAGYVVLQHAVRLDRPVLAYDRWLRRIPTEFYRSVLDSEDTPPAVDRDPFRLASLRNYRSLMPLAQDARKPMFDLRAADGALGSTGRFVQTCEREFRELAHTILRATGVETAPLP